MARSTSSTFAGMGAGTARPWLERLARAGYAARGVVYALVGFLAVETALGARSRPTDTRGALQEIAGHSLALLWAVAVGLAGYALWRIVQGFLDPEHGAILLGLVAVGLIAFGAYSILLARYGRIAI